MPDYEIHWTERHCDVVTAKNEKEAIIKALDNFVITCIDAQAFYVKKLKENE